MRAHRLTAAAALAASVAFVAPPVARPSAQALSPARGEPGLALLLRKLMTVATVMHATAHPDDENNGLLAMQALGEGHRVVLATATRGNGGQNEIGPELFEPLGVLRTEELLAAHRLDGAEQLFTRAVDFGYSFSVDETDRLWGREEILGDFVRLMRTVRPDVVIALRPTGEGGGQHHQASARIATDAFRAAADPARYPEQIAQGLRPWQAKKLYQMAWFNMFPDAGPRPEGPHVTFDGERADRLLGRTWSEIGGEARAMHKCQGFGQLLPLPGSFTFLYRLVDAAAPLAAGREERGFFDDIDTRLTSLARFAGPSPPAWLTRELATIQMSVQLAAEALRAEGPGAAAPPLAIGLERTRGLRHDVKAQLPGDAAYEIDFRLEQTERKFEAALVVAHGLRIEALANDSPVTPGQPVEVTVIAANRGSRDLAVDAIALEGFEGTPACATGALGAGAVVRCVAKVTVPASARMTEPYWRRPGHEGRYLFDDDAPFGQPFRPTTFVARLGLALGGVTVVVRRPVEFRYEGSIFSGEKRMDVEVVPPFSVRLTPEVTIVPVASGDGRARDVKVSVTYAAPGAAEATVALDVPPGWQVVPASAELRFSRPDEASSIRFRVTPPATGAKGEYPVGARVTSGGRAYERGYEVIEYPHTRRRHIYADARAAIKVIDVRIPRGLRVGYVMGVGDQVPPAIEQMGATVEMLDEAALASDDLSRFHAVVTGVRAYERRADLRAYNRRLVDYAEAGGTVIVQYNKFEFNQAQYGPFPAKVGPDRVTDEASAVRVLVPDHPVFLRPNPIGADAWQHWVQERGLYFLGERDARYVDLLELTDPFEYNRGPKKGALVEARVGKGRWIYLGLGLWRQLPAGTEGAYLLLANLLALGAGPG